MSESKTLKDLKRTSFQFVEESVPIKVLKKFIIKWIKEDIEDYRNNDLLSGLTAQQGRNIHNFIVHQRQKWKDRFNISKEDLK